jgi:F-type H+-transporting ATPase subunit c
MPVESASVPLSGMPFSVRAQYGEVNHPLAANKPRKQGATMRKLQYLFMTLSVLFLAAPAYAQSATGSSDAGLKAIAAGVGMAIAAGLCGLGQGRAVASSSEALARNPGARPGIFLFLLLGLAFIESLALFTFVMIFLKVK